MFRNHKLLMMVAASASGAAIPSPLLTDLVFSLKWDGSQFINAVTGLAMVDHGSVAKADPVVSGAADAGAFVAASSKYLSTPDTAALSIGDVAMTVAAWIKMPTPVEAANVAYCAQWLSAGDQRAWVLQYDQSSHADKFAFQASPTGISSGTTIFSATLPTPAVQDTAYFVAAWHDPTANKLYLQVDNGAIYSADYANGIFNSSADFTIGSVANPALYANGSISVDMWKRLLTVDERTALWNGGAGSKYPFDLVGAGATGDFVYSSSIGV